MPRMSKAAMNLCNEIRNKGHNIVPENTNIDNSIYINTDDDNYDSVENIDSCSPKKYDVVQLPVKKRRRKRSKPAVTSYTKPVPTNRLFTVEIVGGIGLPGYPLNEGEKLAIAKLVPVKVRA